MHKIDRNKITHVNYPNKDLLDEIQITFQKYYEKRISKTRAVELSGHIAKNVISFLEKYDDQKVKVFGVERVMFDLDKDEDKLNTKY